MGAFTKELLSKVTVITKHLESGWIAMLLEPAVNMNTAPNVLGPAVVSPVVVDVVDAEKWFVIQATADAFPAIGLQDGRAEFDAPSFIDSLVFLGVILSPLGAVFSVVFAYTFSVPKVILMVLNSFALTLRNRRPPESASAFVRAEIVLGSL